MILWIPLTLSCFFAAVMTDNIALTLAVIVFLCSWRSAQS